MSPKAHLNSDLN